MSRTMKSFSGARVQSVSKPVPQGLPSQVFSLAPPVPVVSVRSVLSQVALQGTPLFTQQQVEALVSLKIGDQDFFSLGNRPFIYEMIGVIMKIGFDAGYAFMLEMASNPVVSIQGPKAILWRSPTLKGPREKHEIDVEIKRNKPESVKSAVVCRFCRSNEVVSAQRQTRSADEPMTTFHFCIACNKKWKE